MRSVARFEILIWLSDVPISSQASPHLHTTHRNLQAQFPRTPCVKMDETRPASLLPLGSLLEDEDAVFTVLPQSFFPYPLHVELDNTLGVGKLTFSKTVEVQEMHLFQVYPSLVECF